MSPKSLLLPVSLLLILVAPQLALSQNTSFSYQGFFKQNNVPANGNFHFEFALYDQLTFGSQLGSTLILDPVAATDGLFVANLDFGNQFNGSNRYLEIHVRPSGGGPLTLLTPRQLILSVPNALNSNYLGGLPAASYIQNSVGQQANANISISGNALFGGNVGVGTLTPNANLNIVGTQPPDNQGPNGVDATDALNIVGARGGRGGNASQGGTGANISIRAGDGGSSPQGSMAEGNGGSITLQPGLTNKPNGNGKIILAPDGGDVGVGTATPESKLDVNGNLRSKSAQIIASPIPPLNGGPAGNSAGTVLEVIGANGGDTSGSTMGTPHVGGNGGNVLIQAGNGGQNLDNPTSDGSGGSITLQPGLTRAPAAPGKVLLAPNGGKVGIGTTNPQSKLDVNGAAATSILAVTNSQPGITDGSPTNIPPTAIRGETTATSDTTIGVLGISNSSMGIGVIGLSSGNGTGNKADATGVLGIATGPTGETRAFSAEVASPNGTALDMHMTSGGTGYLIYASSGLKEGGSSTKFSVSSAGQVDVQGGLNLNGTFTSGQLSISSSNLQTNGNVQANSVTASQNVSVGGFLTAPGTTLQINKDVNLNGTLTPQLLGGGDNHLCNLAPTSTLRFCSSSMRYKENVKSFTGGLDIIKKLKPISFDWKENGRHDVGLGAEDVAAIEPRLTFNNTNGEIEGVKYSQLSVVLINAIKQQQSQIEQQQAQIAALKKRLDRLQNRSARRKVR